MAQRTFTLTGTLTLTGGGPNVGVTVQTAPYSPLNSYIVDGAGTVILDYAATVASTQSNSSGVFSLVTDYPGDFAGPSGANLYLSLGPLTYLLPSFPYAASIDVSTLLPAAGNANPTLLMIVDLTKVNQAALSGSVANVSSNITATAPNGGKLLAGVTTPYTSDGSGLLAMALEPSSTLTPGGQSYHISYADGSYDNVIVPATPTGYVGAYNGGTAYVIGNIVLSGGIYYQCILATTGHAPPNATYWILWAGEPIYSPVLGIDHRTMVAVAGQFAATASNIGASFGVPVAVNTHPSSVQDFISNQLLINQTLGTLLSGPYFQTLGALHTYL